MSDSYIFDLPVYLCAEDEYYAKRGQRIAKRLDAWGLSRERSPNSYRNAEEALEDSYGPWEFNQVVGWIRLYAVGSYDAADSHVCGHLWRVDSKRIQLKMRKRFYLDSPNNILAVCFPLGVVSEDIFSDLLTHLERLAKEERFKKRHVDLETFRNTGPFINWRQLLNDAARREESRLMIVGGAQ